MRTASTASLLTLVLLGCDLGTTECTEAGCVDRVVIAFEPHELAPGRYLLQVGVPGDEVRCEFTLPADPTVLVECSREPFATLYLASGATLGSFELWATPASLTIVLERDGVALFAPQGLTPAWHETYPNGPECAPICEVGDVAVDLPSLVGGP